MSFDERARIEKMKVVTKAVSNCSGDYFLTGNSAMFFCYGSEIPCKTLEYLGYGTDGVTPVNMNTSLEKRLSGWLSAVGVALLIKKRNEGSALYSVFDGGIKVCDIKITFMNMVNPEVGSVVHQGGYLTVSGSPLYRKLLDSWTKNKNVVTLYNMYVLMTRWSYTINTPYFGETYKKLRKYGYHNIYNLLRLKGTEYLDENQIGSLLTWCKTVLSDTGA